MICIAAVSMFLVACGGGNKTVDAQISAYETAITKLESAKTAEDVQKIMDECNKALTDAAAKADTSAVTEAQQKKLTEVSAKFSEAMAKASSLQ